MNKNIIVDIYGADAGPDAVIDGAALALSRAAGFGVVIAGSREYAEKRLIQCGADMSRVSYMDTCEYITNYDNPFSAVKGKTESSMSKALARLSDKDCAGMVSCGNTGALLVGSIFKAGLLGGLKTPALSCMLPRANGRFVCIADCGANVDCAAPDLARFALMGAEFMRCMRGIESPRVGLLSVGREETKGNALVKAAYPLLQALPVDFIGNVEADELPEGTCDVIVCDGFAGNLLLKNAESAGRAAAGIIDEKLSETDEKPVREALTDLKARMTGVFDYNSQGGATFLGVNGIIVKGHGSASPATVCACIEQVLRLYEHGFLQKLAAVCQYTLQ